MGSTLRARGAAMAVAVLLAGAAPAAGTLLLSPIRARGTSPGGGARGAAMAVAALLAGAAPSAATSLLSPIRAGGTSLGGVAGVQKLVLDRTALAELRARDRTVIAGFPLGRKRRADLVLERFEPF